MRIKTGVIFFAMLMAVDLCQAQEVSFLGKVYNLLTKPAPVDTLFVYQPEAVFSMGPLGSCQKAGFDLDVNFKLKNDDGTTMPCVSTYGLSENLCTKIGLDMGYGKVCLNFGLEIGPRSAVKKHSLGLNILGKAWGLHFNYYSISDPFTTSLVMGEAGSEDYLEEQWTPEEMAILRNFSIDGYYVFNNKRFAYPAAYKVGFVQRHSAGSWMVTARYMQGSLYNNPEVIAGYYNLFDCLYTLQASIGGGYSANIVLWHKDPTDARDQGLRNVTVNLTALPVITLVNFLKTTSYTYDEEDNYTGNRDVKAWCYPLPNYIGSAAASLTWNRFFFTTQFTYNLYFFRSRDAFDASQFDLSQYDLHDVRFHGIFHDWLLRSMLVYRF